MGTTRILRVGLDGTARKFTEYRIFLLKHFLQIVEDLRVPILKYGRGHI